MLTAQGCRDRRRRLWGRLADRVDQIMIADPQHLMSFANLFHSPFVFRSNDAGGVLIVGPNDQSILIGDSMSQGFLAQAHVGEVVAPVWYDGKHSAPHREAKLVDSALNRLARCAGSRMGIEASSIPAGILEGLRAQRPGITFVDVDPIIRDLKRRKDPDELALLKASMRAAEAGHEAALRELRPGMTELQAFLLVQRAVQEAAGMQAMLYGDFVSGPRTEEVGGPPSQRVIQPGELFILDFSVLLGQYRCDFANTFVVGGKPTRQLIDMFEACRAALAAGESLLKAGIKCRDVDRAVRGSFAKRHLAAHFGHHTGHGIGVGHPEPPFLVPESAEELAAGDVVTLEPGLYIKGVGGMRYERNYLVTTDGFELLSKHRITLDPN